MNASSLARREAPPAGVIETLSAGYRTINRQPWVLLLPLLVDLLLWIGPQVSVSPLIDPPLVRVGEWVRQVQGSPSVGGSPATATDIESLRQLVLTTASETNVLTLLARGPLALPSVVITLGGVGAFSFVRGWGDGLLLLVGTLAGGLLLGALFRAAIAQQVNQGHPDWLQIGKWAPLGVARTLGLLGVLLGAMLILGVPTLLLVGVAAVVAPVMAGLGLLVVVLGFLVAEIYLFFAVDVIFLTGANPLRAIQRSVLVVRRALWPTMGLVLLTWLILAGMDRVWELLAPLRPPYSLLLASIGNAYIASGLIAAGMIFYKERMDLILRPDTSV